MPDGPHTVSRFGDQARLRIMVVDDYPDAADSLAMLLRLWNHDVRFARSSAEALEMLSSYLPDVALVDLLLPEIDGFRLATLIRERPELRSVVLVAVTGLAGEQHLRKSQEVGFSHYLLKPVEPDQLHAVLVSLAIRKAGGAMPLNSPGTATSP